MKTKEHQITFAELVLSHKNDPNTSKEAARKFVAAGGLSLQEQRVYQALRTFCGKDGLTMGELAGFMAGNVTGNYFMCQRRISGIGQKGKAKRKELYVNNNGKPVYQSRDGYAIWWPITD